MRKDYSVQASVSCKRMMGSVAIHFILTEMLILGIKINEASETLSLNCDVNSV